MEGSFCYVSFYSSKGIFGNFLHMNTIRVQFGQPLNGGYANMSIPIWVIAVAAGIVFSAFMAVKTGKEERKEEMESIEREGELYMKRLEREKEQREHSTEA
jgi:hypothetical protein